MLPYQRSLVVNSPALPLLIACFSALAVSAVQSGSSLSLRRASCANEIENANRTIVSWSVAMRQMIAESSLPPSDGNSIAQEEDKIQELIERFSANMNRRPIERLVKDLESIRRRSNRMSLEIYRKTYDMRWPQTSVQLGAAVERVQHACLSNADRAAMLVMNRPSSTKKHFI